MRKVSRPSSLISRRSLLVAGGAGLALAMTGRSWPARATPPPQLRLASAPSRQSLFGEGARNIPVWAFNGSVPGPELRLRQGEPVRIAVENRLTEETTVHWHGLRVPNAMDGVPHLTQVPIAPGGTFIYEFAPPDAGTYWYHPHQRSFEQVGRGLYGALIVEEREAIKVDRDVTWLLDDWRLTPEGEISNDFGGWHDISHGGRVGNAVTINGQVPREFAVEAGERLRLRLVNAANARIFALEFEGHRPKVLALDGQPVEPHEPEGDRILLGPAMRADLLVDMIGAPGARFGIHDRFYRGLEYKLVDLAYGPKLLRPEPVREPLSLPPNALSEPNIRQAQRHNVTLEGGMMGTLAGARVDGAWRDMRQMMRTGIAWAINRVAGTDHALDPMAVLPRGASIVLDLRNDTAWNHPMHLHGHSFRVLSRNGTPTPRREWQDTVLMAPRERVEIAFVADNPGDWMFHCHILEHQAGGMMGVIRVA